MKPFSTSARKLRSLGSAALLTAGGLYLDAATPLGVAAGLPYLIAVAVCLLSRSRPLVLTFGALGILLTVAGTFFSPGVLTWMAVTNRGLTLAALTLLTWLGHQLLEQQMHLEEKLRILAETDDLTGLASRRYLFEQLDRRVAEAERYGSELSLIIVDLDDFKAVNDELGHPVGDRVLRTVARVSADALRGPDLLGRYGGDELVVLCPSTGREGAERLAERIRVAVEQAEIAELGSEQRITASLGVASWTPEVATTAAFLANADAALYRAKSAGRNRVESAPPPETAAATTDVDSPMKAKGC